MEDVCFLHSCKASGLLHWLLQAPSPTGATIILPSNLAACNIPLSEEVCQTAMRVMRDDQSDLFRQKGVVVVDVRENPEIIILEFIHLKFLKLYSYQATVFPFPLSPVPGNNHSTLFL